MSDTSLNKFLGQGDDAVEGAFTPDPPTTASDPQPLVLFLNTESTPELKYWDGMAFQTLGGGGAGTVTNTGTLDSGKTIVGNGGVDVTVSSLTAQFVGSSSGTPAAASMSTARLLGRTTAGSGAVEEITVGTGLTLAAGSLSASGGSSVVVQVVNTQTGALATGTGTIALDDSIPQNTEGDEVMTLAVTPDDAGNKLQIDVEVAMSNSAGDRWNIVALFQDSTADALKAAVVYMPTATGAVRVTLRHTMTAGTTSATTFKVRIGGNAGGTTTFNGTNGGRLFGGVSASSITITEYVP